MNCPSHLLISTRLRFPPVSVIFLSFAVLLGASGSVMASVINSKHNLSASGPGPVMAKSETQICVFCHTPHGANQSAGAPLWNHALSNATYTPYFSLSLDANPIPGPPGASSKVCLSCHDGTLAVGTVGVLNGKNPVDIAMNGTGTGGVMSDGSGATTGYTRNLGIDLSNDHPISFNYESSTSPMLGGIGGTDGELRAPPVMDGAKTVVGNRTASVKPTFPLEGDQVQCITCHDPHISSNVSLKFLRGNRLQQLQPPTGGLYMASNDIMCIACHDKAGTTWSNSAHSNQLAADETYLDAAATTNEFPLGTAVWQASCLNCHDSHTVQGSRRLLREGTDSLASPKAGGNSAIEQTCYQCHSPSGISILSQIAPANDVPDIYSDYSSPNTIYMPIADQPETHDIGGNFDDSTSAGAGHLANGTTGRCNTAGDQCGKDFMESEAILGKISAGGVISNRHTECTDCHNPHRATKNRLFNADSVTPDAAGTHKHDIVSGDTAPHSNIASGSLRGITGVEPTYPSNEFGVDPTSFDVKRGDGGTAASTLVTDPYVTREYQICLKCHSNYAYDNSPPALGYSNGTLQGTNGMLNYINDAMEFQAPLSHQGAASTADSGASSSYSTNNHRSWHPVMDVTGRTIGARGITSPNLWRTPWNGSDTDGGSTIVTAVGTQTMYCSDCHGSKTNMIDGVMPFGGENGSSWGPHGSDQNFLLKGEWKTDTIPTTTNDTICYRCHEYDQYGNPSTAPASLLASGFGNSSIGNDSYGVTQINMHQRHAYYTTQIAGNWQAGDVGNYRCTMCHTGTVHGWKNKEFLVNLQDVGSELDLITGGVGPAGALGGETAPGPVVLTAGQNVPKGTQVPNSMAPLLSSGLGDGYSNGPYYRGALLGIATTGPANGFPASGSWTKADCTGSCH
jgi:hypothetical protein